MDLSIIVPVFNSKQYLRDCVKSIENQNYLSMEIILVDDGSTDGSSKICKSLEKLFNNIVYIRQDNKGVSSARNVGINIARGNYIFFVDSDDLMNEKALKKIRSKLIKLNFDMILGNYTTWNSNKNTTDIKENISDIKSNNILDFCNKCAKRDWQIPWNPYQAFIKRSILVENNVRFNTNLKVAEDCDFFFKYINYVKKIYITNISFVKYRINSTNSLMKEQDFKKIYSQMYVFSNLFKKFQNNDILKQYFADRYISSLFLIFQIPDKIDREKCYNDIRLNKKIIFRSTNNLKNNIFKFLLKYCGIKSACQITGVLKILKDKKNE